MKSRRFQYFLRGLFVLLMCSCLLFFAGCAARASRMIPSSYDLKNKHPYTVKVEVVGGRETHPLWTSQISDLAFTKALNSAIVQSGVFAAVAKDEKADYFLDVTILHYDQPVIGIDFDVNMVTQWELSKAGQYKRIWMDTVSTTYRAKLGDALWTNERIQKANEGVVRANIKEAIKRLSEIQL
jgi:hypothetical protein